ncbi:hypothetical protein B1P88_00620 [Enterococcus faecium]|nr:hypothetical protein B1P88_00620 [Enterococcus faecium]
MTYTHLTPNELVMIEAYFHQETPVANPALLPLKHKGSSQWGYAWVPVVAPICAGVVAVFLYKLLFMA